MFCVKEMSNMHLFNDNSNFKSCPFPPLVTCFCGFFSHQLGAIHLVYTILFGIALQVHVCGLLIIMSVVIKNPFWLPGPDWVLFGKRPWRGLSFRPRENFGLSVCPACLLPTRNPGVGWIYFLACRLFY